MLHKEADLHLSFCKWLKRTYPNDNFIRHEREGKRSPYMQNLFQIYNHGIDKLPDFEALIGNGFYIEFKKPGEKWLLRDNLTVKPAYASQYVTHKLLWSIGRCVWFCNDLEVAKGLYDAYKVGNPEPMQKYLFPVSDFDKSNAIANDFFTKYEG